MSNEVGKRRATLGALLELKETIAQGDLKAAQDCRDKRLILAVDLFSGDRQRHDALQQLFDMSGRWVSGSGSAAKVREALKRAILLFGH
jgi:hypothetical protein